MCALVCLPPLQEEYLLNPAATMRLVARLAKEGGVKAVSDSVYPYLSLAAETFLGQLLNNMVKMRLQREDLGK
jgi:histone H3/H4